MKISAKSVIGVHPLERQVLQKLLTLADQELTVSDLKLLRLQLQQAVILSRQITGHGFYTRFLVAQNATRLANRRSLWFGQVAADIAGLQHGAGFQLHIEDGAADLLEGFSYDGPWPDPWPGEYNEAVIYEVYEVPHSARTETSK